MLTIFLTFRETNKLPPQSLRKPYIWLKVKLNITGVVSPPTPKMATTQQLPYRSNCYPLAEVFLLSVIAPGFIPKFFGTPYC